MKKLIGLLLAIATPSLASQQLVHAGSVSTSFPVTVSVGEACTGAATGFAFPAYSSVGVDSTSTIDVTCAQNAPYEITLNGGNNFNARTGHRRMASGATVLEYQLYQQNGFQTVWGDSGFQGTMPNGTRKRGLEQAPRSSTLSLDICIRTRLFPGEHTPTPYLSPSIFKTCGNVYNEGLAIAWRRIVSVKAVSGSKLS